MATSSRAARDAYCLGNSEYFIPKLSLAEALFLLCLTALSTVTVGAELGRLWWRHKHHKSTTAIAKLLETLVGIQGIVDFFFHVVDFFFVGDCVNIPLGYVLMYKPLSALQTERTLIYKSVKEGLGLLSVWWHAVTAYAIYCWIVRKYSANRLKVRRLPYLIVAAMVVTTTRMVLWQTLRKDFLGLRLGNILYDFLAVPLPILCIFRWNLGSARALAEYNKHALPVPAASASLVPAPVDGAGTTLSGHASDQEQAAGPLQSLRSRSHLPRGAFQPSMGPGGAGGVGHSVQQTQRNRIIIARLLRVSIVVSIMWIWIVGVNATLWATFFKTGHLIPEWAMWVRTILMRLVGFIDAVIMHDLFKRWWLRILSCWRICTGSGVRDAQHMAAAAAAAAAAAVEGGMMAGYPDFRMGPGHTGEGPLSVESMGKEGVSSDMEVARSGEGLGRTYGRAMEGQEHATASVLMFVSTYNMGGITLKDAIDNDGLAAVLPTWIPLDYDLYVIGVQECCIIREFRRAVHKHLGGPEAYVMVGKEIGDDRILHGFIALTIFARTQDVATGAVYVQEGAVDRVASGVSFGPMGRAPNKGFVGLSMRVHDTSLALITAHFASDKKGRNRLGKRNQDARRTLSDMSLLWDSDDFSIHTQHHFTVVLGDLNYRNRGHPEEILEMVAHSARECQDSVEAAQARASGARGETGGGDSPSPTPRKSWRSSYDKFFALPEARRVLVGKPGSYCMETNRFQRAVSEYGSAGKASPSSRLTPLSLGRRNTSLVGTYIKEESMEQMDREEEDGDPEIEQDRWQQQAKEGTKRPYLSTPVSLPALGQRMFDISALSSNSSTDNPKTEGGEQNVSGTSLNISGLPGPQKSGFSSRSSSSTPALPSNESSILSMLRPYPLGIRPSLSSPVDYFEGRHHCRHPFDWVERTDELSVTVRQQKAFYAFEEGRISFPPSYRWNRVLPVAGVRRLGSQTGGGKVPREGSGVNAPEGNDPPAVASVDLEAGSQLKAVPVSLAGDFTSVETLSNAYSLTVLEKPGFSSSFAKSLVRSLSLGGGLRSREQGKRPGGEEEGVSEDGTMDREGSWKSVVPNGSENEGPCPDSPSRLAEHDSEGTKEASGPAGMSARTPSYTDRILTHSMPAKASQFRWLLYDSADLVGFSDHRPVAAAFELRADERVRGFQTLASVSSSAVAPDGPRLSSISHAPPPSSNVEPQEGNMGPVPKPLSNRTSSQGVWKDLAVFTISMSRPSLRLNSPTPQRKKVEHKAFFGGTGGKRRPEGLRRRGSIMVLPEMGVTKPSRVQILFPIVSEDPFAFERKASQLGAALPGLGLEVNEPGNRENKGASMLKLGGTQGHEQQPPGGVEGPHRASSPSSGSQERRREDAFASSLRTVPWEDFPVRFQVVASLRFSEHMLLKISDSRNHDLGEAIIPIRIALPHVAGAFSHEERHAMPQSAENEGPFPHPTEIFDVGAGKCHSSVHSKRNHRYRFALSAGGEFKGFLSVDLKVRHRPFSGNELSINLREGVGSDAK
ncbi:endonuclease exonuclease phosphatase family protein [Nannochloropsis gaditana]|uniref:Endonuclease exonuclease phosphatase family protein n=3 Tax=Nannochloropsis gaditana TaxID=72520 RepID=W7TF42_9STRA|nr:endonuclease exonuclease phosphatase family protein [Nannochloropsis gaditana]